MAEPARRCALDDAIGIAHAPLLAAGDLRVEALSLMGHVLIQLPAGGASKASDSALALELPTVPNRATGLDPVLMRLGPRAWVAITASPDAAAFLAQHFVEGLRPAGGHAVDLSDAHQSLRISGRAARELIGQSCALDLDGVAFDPGAATRTSIARMPAILHRVAADSFVLHVDRSLARQFWDWFGQGVREMAALAALPGAAAR